MVVQPFLENSIIHGINPIKDRTGEVKVHFKREGKRLKIVVDDNGIGRKKAQENKVNSIAKERSLGMKITENRIAAISHYGPNTSGSEGQS